MPYACFVHVDRGAMAAMSDEERATFERENDAYARWLGESGHMVMASSLHEPETATLIRSGTGQVSMTDGPYIETKEHLGGFIVLKVRDRQQAVDIAAMSPVARYGTIEVRAMNHPEFP